ncbi:MAG TPA: ABC transporter substrate-binding protein [Rhodothermales bacterium]|nr:ABC transporter substrate-binding protein [Rhodothermales bacterium]
MKHARWSTFVLLLTVAAFMARPAHAQVVTPEVPAIEQAETFFQQGLEAFQQGDYDGAYRRFRLVYETFPLNRKTTAATLMAGKALYRSGDYRTSAQLLTSFVSEYPKSSYVDDARRTISRAESVLENGPPRQPVSLGILLPLSADNVALTQALFNGIHLAVEEHNATPGAVPVRMVFRSSAGGPDQAAAAAADLINEGQVSAVIGPIFSPEAMAAGNVAEASGVVLVAPLATDEEVSEGREFVFQANPTITVRGQQMADFAVRTLGLRDFGIIAEEDEQSISERMAEGFQQEALQLGAAVKFFSTFPTGDGWSHLPEEIGDVRLSTAKAVYMPLPGENSARKATAALTGLDQMNVSVQVLGNSEWNGLNAISDASKYNTTFSDEFLVDQSNPALQTFQDQYRATFGKALVARDRRLPLTGYDVTRFILQQMGNGSGERLRQALHRAPRYQGLGIRLDFSEGNVNEALYFLRYEGGQIERLK